MANPAVLTAWLFVLSAVCGGTAVEDRFFVYSTSEHECCRCACAVTAPSADMCGDSSKFRQVMKEVQETANAVTIHTVIAAIQNVTHRLGLLETNRELLTELLTARDDIADLASKLFNLVRGDIAGLADHLPQRQENSGKIAELQGQVIQLTEQIQKCNETAQEQEQEQEQEQDSGFRNATFTTLGTTGRAGPTSLGDHYRGQDHEHMVTLCNGIQLFKVPEAANYRIQAAGAAAGWDRQDNAKAYRGRGALVMGTFSLQKGEVLKILVGQEGAENSASISAGGGGGTFVTESDDSPLIIAGGGGGGQALRGHHAECDGTAGTSGQAGYSAVETFPGGTNGHGATVGSGIVGGGGGGLLSNGGSSQHFGGTDGTSGGEGGYAFVDGGFGGRAQYNDAVGGFGGGGGAYGIGGGGGGGGGYSGGGRGFNTNNACAGGGGSYNTGSDPHGQDGKNDAPGYVVITKM